MRGSQQQEKYTVRSVCLPLPRGAEATQGGGGTAPSRVGLNNLRDPLSTNTAVTRHGYGQMRGFSKMNLLVGRHEKL